MQSAGAEIHKKPAVPGYLFLVFVLMISSSYVMIEPAPVDLGIVGLLTIGILLNRLNFSFTNIAPAFIFLYIFIIAAVFSMFEMSNVPIGMRDFAITLYLIISWYFFLGIISKYGDSAIKALMSGYTIAALLSATLGILAYFNVIPWQDVLLKFGRVKGFFKDFNVFGPFLIPIALYAYSFIEISKKRHKIWWLIAFLILLLGIFLSFSRAAMGNFILSFLLFVGFRFFMAPSLKQLAKFSFTLLLLSATFAYILSLPSVNQMVIERFEYQYYDDDRFKNQANALEVAISNPLGIGPGQYEISSGFATHNSYLRVLSENGIVGFIGFAGFLMITLYRCLKLILLTKDTFLIIIFSSSIGLLFNSLVVDTIHWRHLWFIFAIPWAYNYAKIRKAKRNQR